MLKIHSFLQRTKKSIKKIFPYIGKYKIRMAVIAYTMTTVLFIISPDYIYGGNKANVESIAKAKISNLVTNDMVEETAYEAIVRTNLNTLGNQFILCDLTTDGTPIEKPEYQTLNLAMEGQITNNLFSLVTVDSNEATKEKNTDANSKEEGADAEQVDSSSTKEEKKENTVKITEKEKQENRATKEKTKSTVKESKKADKKQITEQTESKEEEIAVEALNTTKKVLDLSKKDIEILQRIVEAEATGEDLKGKILVANVILNRVKDDDFPNNIEEVVFQKDGNTYQFSPIKDNRYWSVKISKDTVKAIERVMEGEDYSKGALFFSARSRASKSNMRWFDNNLEYLFKYGGHEFFTK